MVPHKFIYICLFMNHSILCAAHIQLFVFISVRVGWDSHKPLSLSTNATSDEDTVEPLDGHSHVGSKRIVKTALKSLDEYARFKGKNLTDVEDMSTADLDKFLGRFYAELRKSDGSMYAHGSLLATRYGLQQHFKETKNINIILSSDFESANAIFSAVLLKVKQYGKEFVRPKEPLTVEDFRKLYSSHALNTSTPVGLQNKVFVDVMVHLCHRGLENLRTFRLVDFKTMFDSRGNKYICMRDSLRKNDREVACTESREQSRMYETPGYQGCPVSSFEKYVSKLNVDCSAFWQAPIEKLVSDNASWYKNLPLGKNSLYNKMKTLSEVAGLSKVYTNHCLRTTRLIPIIPSKQSTFESRGSLNDSGEQSEPGIRSYIPIVTDRNLNDMNLAKMSLTNIPAGNENTVCKTFFI